MQQLTKFCLIIYLRSEKSSLRNSANDIQSTMLITLINCGLFDVLLTSVCIFHVMAQHILSSKQYGNKNTLDPLIFPMTSAIKDSKQ